MKIELIPAEPRFAELWFQWRQEANTIRFNPLAPTTLEQIRVRLSASCSSLADLRAAQEFSFFARAGEQVVGSLTLKGISQMMGYGEIGYTIGEAFQGRGVGTAAVRALIEKIFAETELRRIVASVAENYQASRKLLERLGFVTEGTLREHYILNGVPTNEIHYGLLRRDWRG